MSGNHQLYVSKLCYRVKLFEKLYFVISKEIDTSITKNIQRIDNSFFSYLTLIIVKSTETLTLSICKSSILGTFLVLVGSIFYIKSIFLKVIISMIWAVISFILSAQKCRFWKAPIREIVKTLILFFENNVASSILIILNTSTFTILSLNLLYGHLSKNGQGGSEFACPPCTYRTEVLQLIKHDAFCQWQTHSIASK